MQQSGLLPKNEILVPNVHTQTIQAPAISHDDTAQEIHTEPSTSSNNELPINLQIHDSSFLLDFYSTHSDESVSPSSLNNEDVVKKQKI